MRSITQSMLKSRLRNVNINIAKRFNSKTTTQSSCKYEADEDYAKYESGGYYILREWLNEELPHTHPRTSTHPLTTKRLKKQNRPVLYEAVFDEETKELIFVKYEAKD